MSRMGDGDYIADGGGLDEALFRISTPPFVASSGTSASTDIPVTSPQGVFGPPVPAGMINKPAGESSGLFALVLLGLALVMVGR